MRLQRGHPSLRWWTAVPSQTFSAATSSVDTYIDGYPDLVDMASILADIRRQIFDTPASSVRRCRVIDSLYSACLLVSQATATSPVPSNHGSMISRSSPVICTAMLGVWRFAGHAVVGVAEAFLHHTGEVAVSETVDDVAALAASGDQPSEAQFGQMLADRGTGGAGGAGERGDIGFALGQKPQQVQPG